VRLPAAYTGVFGFKPSYGLLSRWGVIPYANSLDTVGVLTNSVQDAHTLFNILNKHDTHDPTALSQSVRSRIASTHEQSAKQLRIGIPVDYNISELSSAVRQTYIRLLQTLQSLGYTLVPVSLPSTRQALSAYYVLAPAEASSNLAKYDGIRYGYRTSGPDALPRENLPLYARTRGEGYGDEVKRRILLGAYTLSSEAIDNYFIQAQKVRRLVQRDFDRVFARQNLLLDANEANEGRADRDRVVDVLITPTAPTLPPTVEEVKQQTPVESYMNDVFTVPASLAGLPAASVPVLLPREVRGGMEESDVRSVGMQVVGQFGDDEGVLEVARIVEELQ
jgi:aspartyl-tRNA(Asn)/glutamyl-tRNA(Gln) amidotransferase subunit A